MKTIRALTQALLVALFVTSALAAPGMQEVEYISDSMAEKEGQYIRLLGGSLWVLSSPTLALVTDDIIIVLEDVEIKNSTKAKVAIAYIDGDEIVAKHVDGGYASEIGYLTTVVEAWDGGAVLELADGSFLSIPKYDQYHTGWWLPPYRALLTANKMYLWNLQEGKRVWVDPK